MVIQDSRDDLRDLLRCLAMPFQFQSLIFVALTSVLLGFFIGRMFGSIEGIDKYFTLLVLAFFFIPGIPALIHLWKGSRDDIMAKIKSLRTRH